MQHQIFIVLLMTYMIDKRFIDKRFIMLEIQALLLSNCSRTSPWDLLQQEKILPK